MKYFILGIALSVFGCIEQSTSTVKEYQTDTLHVIDTIFKNQPYPYNLGRLISIYPFPTETDYKLRLDFLKDTVYVWYLEAQSYGKIEFSDEFSIWIIDSICIYTQSEEGCLKYWKE